MVGIEFPLPHLLLPMLLPHPIQQALRCDHHVFVNLPPLQQELLGVQDFICKLQIFVLVRLFNRFAF